MYQLCDIADGKVREVFETNLAGGGDTVCDRQYGWLTRAEHREVYRVMKGRLDRRK
jgi:hypothetical protein